MVVRGNPCDAGPQAPAGLLVFSFLARANVRRVLSATLDAERHEYVAYVICVSHEPFVWQTAALRMAHQAPYTLDAPTPDGGSACLPPSSPPILNGTPFLPS